MNQPRFRKPRFRRIFDPPNVRLTERDFLILRLLSEHRFLQSHHLTALVPGSSQHLIRRLQALFHAGLIDRPKQQLRISLPFHNSFAYCLTERGRKELESRGIPVFPGVPRLQGSASAYSLTHDLLVSETVVALRRNVVAMGIEFLWYHQLLPGSAKSMPGKIQAMRWSVSIRADRKSKRTFVIPDAAFALRSAEQSSAWFLLELDRGTMPVTRTDPTQTCFLRKIHAYKETRRAGVLWKRHEIPGFRVLVVTESRKRMRSLQEATAATFQRGDSKMFLFACLKDLIEVEDPLGPIWETCSGEKDSLIPS